MRATHLALFAALPLLFTSLTRAAEPEKYLPADATIVVRVNVRQILDSPLGKKYGPDAVKNALSQNGQIRQLLETLGVDPLKDVDTLFLATPGASANGAVVVAHGRIDQERFHKAAEDVSRKTPGAMKIHKEGALTIYEGKHGGDPAFATFPSKDTLLLSPSRAALTAAASGTNTLGKDVAGLVGQVDGRQSVWAAALLPDDAKRALTKQPQTAELASKIKGFTVAVNVDRDVQMNLNVLTTEAKAAESIAELLEGLKGLGKLYAASVPQIGPYLGQAMDSIKIATSQASVTAAVQVSEQTIDQVVKAAQVPPPAPKPAAIPVKKRP
jgi:hypothetical protein